MSHVQFGVYPIRSGQFGDTGYAVILDLIDSRVETFCPLQT